MWRLALGCLLATAVACSAQDDAFYAKTFTCDRNAAGNSCGTTRTGKPMTCFAGSQLGGADFCTEACDPAQGSNDPRFVCLASGALLQVCHPHAATMDPSAGCPSGLQCYRTDLLNNDGVCLDMRVCTTDADCAGDPSRRTCATTIAETLFPELSSVDSLQCLQSTCASAGSACQSGESCLGAYYELGTVPDICVPNCDANLRCPPNFSCVRATTGPGSPPICIPGIPGERCATDQDCMVGTCFDTGAGFNECVLPLPCTSDLNCALLDRPAQSFVCIASASGDSTGCVALTPYHGADCTDRSDCPPDQDCFRYSPYLVAQMKGECRIPCGSDGTCGPRGGVPQTCLDNGAGGCYPGDFALPCTDSSNCIAEFSCLAASPDERTVITSPTICTTACESDDDCRNNPLIQVQGFCKEGLCRLSGTVGAPCERDAQCRAGVCLLDGSGNGQCTS